MSDDRRRHPLADRRVVYEMPGMDAVRIRRDERHRTTDGSDRGIFWIDPGSSSRITLAQAGRAWPDVEGRRRHRRV